MKRFSVEEVRRDKNGVNTYHLLYRGYKGYKAAENRLDYYHRIFPTKCFMLSVSYDYTTMVLININ